MFDLEEYRADLSRRRDALRMLAEVYYRKFSLSKRDGDRTDWFRCEDKARGIDIALALLPKEGEE